MRKAFVGVILLVVFGVLTFGAISFLKPKGGTPAVVSVATPTDDILVNQAFTAGFQRGSRYTVDAVLEMARAGQTTVPYDAALARAVELFTATKAQ